MSIDSIEKNVHLPRIGCHFPENCVSVNCIFPCRVLIRRFDCVIIALYLIVFNAIDSSLRNRNALGGILLFLTCYIASCRLQPS